MGLNADGSEPVEAPNRPRIPVHFFFSLCFEMDQGRLTTTQVKNGLNMDTSEESEFDSIAATRPTGNTTANLVARQRWMMGLHSILMLADGRHRRPVPGYTTAAGVRAQLATLDLL